jgi:hypothetical protein
MCVSPHGFIVTRIQAVDPDDDPFVFEAVNDGLTPFSLNASGWLLVNTSAMQLSREDAFNYTIRVNLTETACDVGPLLSASQGISPFRVDVVDVAEAPYFIMPSLDGNGSHFRIAESNSPGAVAGVIQFFDEDVGSSFVVSLLNAPGSLEASTFEVSPNGTLVVLEVMDYETTSFYALSVTAVDSTGLRTNVTVKVQVLNVNEPPQLTCLSEPLIAIDEKYVGIAKDDVPRLVVYDYDVNDTLHFVVTCLTATETPCPIEVEAFGGPHNYTGLWNVTYPQLPGSLTVSIRLHDAGGANASAVCSVFVRFADVNDAPFFNMSTTVASVSELSQRGQRVLLLEGRDADQEQTLVYSLSPTEPYLGESLFNIEPVFAPSGLSRSAWLVLAGPRLDYELVSEYRLNLTLTDAGGPRSPGPFYAFVSIVVRVVDELDTPAVWSVDGGSTFGLSTSGNEILTIRGRYFGSARPGKFLNGQPWVVDGAQRNIQVRFSCRAATSSLCVSHCSVWLRVTTWCFARQVYYRDSRSPDSTVFAASSCTVLEEPAADWTGALRCLSVPGFGKADVWTVVVSNVSSPENRSIDVQYAPPSIARFEGAGATHALTGGNETIYVLGTQFGTIAANAITWVRYGQDDRYTAAACRVVKDHVKMECRTSPGIGRNLRWSVSIGNLSSITPTTDYEAPLILNITGPGSQSCSTQGGQIVVITGLNFGPINESPVSINLVSYSSTAGGLDLSFKALLCNVTVDHTEIQCFTAPGIGVGLQWVVSIGGQARCAATVACLSSCCVLVCLR